MTEDRLALLLERLICVVENQHATQIQIKGLVAGLENELGAAHQIEPLLREIRDALLRAEEREKHPIRYVESTGAGKVHDVEDDGGCYSDALREGVVDGLTRDAIKPQGQVMPRGEGDPWGVAYAKSSYNVLDHRLKDAVMGKEKALKAVEVLHAGLDGDEVDDATMQRMEGVVRNAVREAWGIQAIIQAKKEGALGDEIEHFQQKAAEWEGMYWATEAARVASQRDQARVLEALESLVETHDAQTVLINTAFWKDSPRRLWGSADEWIREGGLRVDHEGRVRVVIKDQDGREIPRTTAMDPDDHEHQVRDAQMHGGYGEDPEAKQRMDATVSSGSALTRGNSAQRDQVEVGGWPRSRRLVSELDRRRVEAETDRDLSQVGALKEAEYREAALKTVIQGKEERCRKLQQKATEWQRRYNEVTERATRLAELCGVGGGGTRGEEARED